MLETVANMDPWVVCSFVLAGMLLNMTPGADVIFASAAGISGGPRVGVAASAGISLGSLMHACLAATGIAALLDTYPIAYDTIRYLGAAYLVFLAVKSWRVQATPDGMGETRILSAISRGFLTNALNPKVALFTLALLPQFTNLAWGPVWHQILVLGLLFSTTGFFITSAYAVAAGRLGHTLKARSALMNKLTSLVFGGLALKLVLD